MGYSVILCWAGSKGWKSGRRSGWKSRKAGIGGNNPGRKLWKPGAEMCRDRRRGGVGHTGLHMLAADLPPTLRAQQLKSQVKFR